MEVSKGLTADTQILAARFDNLKEGAQAKVVPQRAAASASAATRASAPASSTPQS